MSSKADAQPETEAGQAVYEPWVLRVYDFYVLGLSNSLLWRCPSRHLVAHYDRHVSGQHLDVGVGSGYFLDRCRFPTERPSVTLMDLNDNSLEFTARRIARYEPTIHRGDVLAPVELPKGHFHSVGINYLLHFLPGEPLGAKWSAFDHLGEVLADNGVLFGSTILHEDLPGGARPGPAQRALMDIYNRKGIFGNAHDGLTGLTEALEARFEQVEVDVRGVVALFAARGVRRSD